MKIIGRWTNIDTVVRNHRAAHLLLIGLDAASQRKKFGYAIGRLEDGQITVLDQDVLGSRAGRDAIATVLAPYLRDQSIGIVAIDAPLGWPELMGKLLGPHRAGQHISAGKNGLFRRTTDNELWNSKRARPLEIGADRIARASHEALTVLNKLRSASGRTIPLAWQPTVTEWSAIEVYPAATLAAHGTRSSGYKKSGNIAERREIAQRFETILPALSNLTTAEADIFDACLCLLCAKDFLEGAARGPAEHQRAIAEKEGWIWVRST